MGYLLGLMLGYALGIPLVIKLLGWIENKESSDDCLNCEQPCICKPTDGEEDV